MIVRLTASRRSIEIDDPRNVRVFSVRTEGAPDAAAEAELFRRIFQELGQSVSSLVRN